jgi:hypothetical protein
VERRARAVIGLLAIASLARLLSLLWSHPLNWDEIEFFRAADWIRQGLVPYRDFWEHHTPLHWFVFAPVTALVKSRAGVSAIIAMRVAQIPLWVLTLWALSRWMKGVTIEAWARWSAITILLCSSFFMLAAVEFRVDTLACALYAVGILLIQQQKHFAAGVVLCLAGFANIRLGPLLVVTMLLAVLIDPAERRWRISWPSTTIFAGALVAFEACVSYFLFTHSAAIAYRYAWTDNYLAEKLAPSVPWMLLHRMAIPFGFRIIGGPSFVAAAIDPATIIMLAVGILGVVYAIATRWRTPDGFFFLAVLEVINILFVVTMKFLYNYHFEIVMLLMVPFVGAALSDIPGRLKPALTPAIAVLVVINVMVVVFRGKEDDLAYQNRIMTAVNQNTPADGKVFDGVGWALRRRPAYRYWFLRAIVNVLEKSGRFPPYTVADMQRDPPAAFISDYGARVWLATHPDLRRHITSHYLPLWRDLWLPGMSGVLLPRQRGEWIVPASGQYRIYSSAPLALHPWFRDPIGTGSYARSNAYVRLPTSRAVATLHRGDRFVIQSRDLRPIGVFIVPVERTELFRQPPPGVDIDGAFLPVTHVPHFSR